MLRKKTVIVIALTVLFVFFCTLHHLLKTLPENEIKSNSIEDAIYAQIRNLPDMYKNPGQPPLNLDLFLKSINQAATFRVNSLDLPQLWNEANSWSSSGQLTNFTSPNIGKALLSLKYTRIKIADLDPRGTQLKLLLTLNGGQQCVFKPQWYTKDKLIQGPVYAGKDRYNSEIVAFYLSLLLEKPIVPLSVERTVSLKHDIMPVATKRLVNTTFETVGNRTCIYGKCYYCKLDDPICENEHNHLTGAVIFNVRKSFSNYRSPWQRTYKKGKKAVWEVKPDYCKFIKTKLTRKRIFDLIDTAIFDFLMQNGDRHHYETLEDAIVWVDNGKGLGNPQVQHTDILAPLYQCCMIRKKMWTTLRKLSGGNLSKYMKLMPDIANLLTEAHLSAMEERLLFIFATIEFCKPHLDIG